jgi:MFS family permease
VAVPVFGRLGDLYGKRLMLLVTLVTFVAGSLICAFTSDIGVMIAGRAVVGLSVAAIPVGISLVGTVLPPKRAGTGIAYAAMPSLILRSAPRGELAAANGLNSLARAVGSSLASAVGGTILTSQVIILGGLALPSLSAYRTLFAICAAAAIAGAVIALVIPASPAVSAAAAADTASAH